MSLSLCVDKGLRKHLGMECVPMVAVVALGIQMRKNYSHCQSNIVPSGRNLFVPAAGSYFLCSDGILLVLSVVQQNLQWFAWLGWRMIKI